MPAPILALRHHPVEGPGLVETVARQRGVEVHVAEMPGQFPHWPEPVQYGGLLVLGGPLSVYDTQRYAWLKDEIRLLRRCRDEGIPILGICLGAQLLAAAFDAKVYDGGRKEIGWGPVEFMAGSRKDTLLEDLPKELTVFHWHGDTFDLPQDAQLLARSPVFTNQAFRIGDRCHGLQFHLEVTEGMPQAWAQDYAAELEETGGPTVGGSLEESEAHIAALRPYAEGVFNRWLDLVERLG